MRIREIRIAWCSDSFNRRFEAVEEIIVRLYICMISLVFDPAFEVAASPAQNMTWAAGDQKGGIDLVRRGGWISLVID